MAPPEIIFGGGSIAAPRFSQDFSNPSGIASALSILHSHGIKKIDTAGVYANADHLTSFIIDHKWSGTSFRQPALTKDQILTEASTNNTGNIDIYYIHAWDTTVPIAETLSGVNEAYEKGLFKRFGISNFSLDQVKQVLTLCRENNYIRPTVYQGLYTPLNRNTESALLPFLRENGIAFVAYGYLGGGFLTKTRAEVESKQSRFGLPGIGMMFGELYDKPEYLAALDKWNAIAKSEGVAGAELATRWMVHHSALDGGKGDGLLVGANSASRLEETLRACEMGPLSEGTVKGIEEAWMSVEGVAYGSYMDAMAVAMGKMQSQGQA